MVPDERLVPIPRSWPGLPRKDCKDLFPSGLERALTTPRREVGGDVVAVGRRVRSGALESDAPGLGPALQVFRGETLPVPFLRLGEERKGVVRSHEHEGRPTSERIERPKMAACRTAGGMARASSTGSVRPSASAQVQPV